MNLAHDLIVDPIVDPPTPEREKHLATWYTQGHSDGLGDRLLMFDNTSAPSWEILRFNPTIAHVPGFEAAVRERVDQLRSFRHAAFPSVRAIEELGREDGLAVASTYAAGVRLTDALKKPRTAAFTVRLIRQLTPAVAALQRHGLGVAHGALTVDRVVITAEGRLMIREHMVGSALEALRWPPARLWSQIGIVVRGASDDNVTLDSRADVVQLGVIALSLIAGLRVGIDDYPEKVESILDRVIPGPGQPPESLAALRRWVCRALQIAPDPFESAIEANEALADLADDWVWPDDLLFPRPELRDVSEPNVRGPRLVSSRLPGDAVETRLLAASTDVPDDRSDRPVTRTSGFSGRAIALGAIGIAALAVGEGLYLRRVASARAAAATPQPSALSIESPEPGAQVWVDNRLVGATPLQLTVDSKVRSIRVLPPPAKPEQTAQQPAPTVGDAKETIRPAASTKTGGFRISAPVQVYVLDGERVLGSSTEGPIFATAGPHEFEFVNTAIGYRARRTIDIKPGQVSALTVNVPNGTLNINAAPWASVWVDGNAVGDTPIGNLSIAPGQHEIVFRHPQFGERREKTIVRADGPTRVTANLQR